MFPFRFRSHPRRAHERDEAMSWRFRARTDRNAVDGFQFCDDFWRGRLTKLRGNFLSFAHAELRRSIA